MIQGLGANSVKILNTNAGKFTKNLGFEGNGLQKVGQPFAYLAKFGFCARFFSKPMVYFNH